MERRYLRSRSVVNQVFPVGDRSGDRTKRARSQLKLELDHLQMRIDEADAVIKKTAGENEACRRLVAIPGIGPITATAIIAAIGNGAAFKKGESSQPGSESSRANIPPVAGKSCWGLANAGTPTCEDSSCTGLEPCCNRARSSLPV